MSTLMPENNFNDVVLPLPTPQFSPPNLAHELRNVASNLNIYTKLLEQNNLPPEKRTKYLQTLQHQVERLVSVADGVSDEPCLQVAAHRHMS